MLRFAAARGEQGHLAQYGCVVATTATPAWQPTLVKRVIRVLATSTRPIEVEMDDGIRAFVKVLGNPEGPSALACEFIGTVLAHVLGIPAFEVAVSHFPEELCVPLEHGLRPEPGPCYATRAVTGISWDGTPESLDAIENPEHVTGLVVLDILLRNPDRHFVRLGRTRRNLRNVFLAEDGVPRGSFRLTAIDHTHCLRQDGELTQHSLSIGNERDEQLYGLFPAFIERIEREDLAPYVERLRQFAHSNEIDDIVNRTPRPWLPAGQVRQDLPGFLKRRAVHVAANVENWLAAACGWDTPTTSNTPTTSAS